MRLARQMYDELGEYGKRVDTVAEIAAEFGVSRPMIYRRLAHNPARGRRRFERSEVSVFGGVEIAKRA